MNTSKNRLSKQVIAIILTLVLVFGPLAKPFKAKAADERAVNPYTEYKDGNMAYAENMYSDQLGGMNPVRNVEVTPLGPERTEQKDDGSTQLVQKWQVKFNQHPTNNADVRKPDYSTADLADEYWANPHYAILLSQDLTIKEGSEAVKFEMEDPARPSRTAVSQSYDSPNGVPKGKELGKNVFLRYMFGNAVYDDELATATDADTVEGLWDFKYVTKDSDAHELKASIWERTIGMEFKYLDNFTEGHFRKHWNALTGNYQTLGDTGSGMFFKYKTPKKTVPPAKTSITTVTFETVRDPDTYKGKEGHRTFVLGAYKSWDYAQTYIRANYKYQDVKFDSDGDGLTDDFENKIGSDPFSKDTDGDGREDGVEVRNTEMHDSYGVQKYEGTDPTVIPPNKITKPVAAIAGSKVRGKTQPYKVVAIVSDGKTIANTIADKNGDYVLTLGKVFKEKEDGTTNKYGTKVNFLSGSDAKNMKPEMTDAKDVNWTSLVGKPVRLEIWSDGYDGEENTKDRVRYSEPEANDNAATFVNANQLFKGIKWPRLKAENEQMAKDHVMASYLMAVGGEGLMNEGQQRAWNTVTNAAGKKPIDVTSEMSKAIQKAELGDFWGGSLQPAQDNRTGVDIILSDGSKLNVPLDALYDYSSDELNVESVKQTTTDNSVNVTLSGKATPGDDNYVVLERYQVVDGVEALVETQRAKVGPDGSYSITFDSHGYNHGETVAVREVKGDGSSTSPRLYHTLDLQAASKPKITAAKPGNGGISIQIPTNAEKGDTLEITAGSKSYTYEIKESDIGKELKFNDSNLEGYQPLNDGDSIIASIVDPVGNRSNIDTALVDGKAPKPVEVVGDINPNTNSFTIKKPTDDGERIVITVPTKDGDTETIVLNKDGNGNWKDASGKTVPEQGGNLTITLPDSKLISDDGDVGFAISDKNENTAYSSKTIKGAERTNAPTDLKVIKEGDTYYLTGSVDEAGKLKIVPVNRNDAGEQQGAPVEQDVQAGAFKVALPNSDDYKEGTTLSVTNKAADKKESLDEMAVMDKTAPEAPVVGDAYPGDTTVTILPVGDTVKMDVTVPTASGDKTITVTKGENGWTYDDGTQVTSKDGQLVIDLSKAGEGTKLDKQDDANSKVITAKVYDPTGNSKEYTTPIKKQTAAPTDVKLVKEGDNYFITGKAPEGSKVELLNNNGESTQPATEVEVKDGAFKIPVPEGFNDQDVVNLVAKKDGEKQSDKTPVTIDKTAPTAPTAVEGNTGDNKVKVTLPADAAVGDVVTVTVGPKNGQPEVTKTYTVKKEDLEKEPKEVEISLDAPLEANKTISATLSDPVGNTSTAVTTDTKTKTTKPSDVKVVKKGDGYVVTGKAPAGSVVEVLGKDGASTEPKSTATATDGTFEIPLPAEYADGDEVSVTAKEDGKDVSDKSKATVDKTAPDAPKAVSGKLGETEVTVTLPDGAKKGDVITVKVTDKDSGNPITKTHTVTEDDLKGKKTVKVDIGRELAEGDKYSATLSDEAGNTSNPKTGEVKGKSATPTEVKVIKDPEDGKYYVVGKGVNGATVEVLDSKGKAFEPAVTGTVTDGSFKIELPDSVNDGDELKVVTTEPNKEKSDPATAQVDKTAPDSPTGVTAKKGENKVTVTLPDGAKKGDVVTVKVTEADGTVTEKTHTVTDEDLKKNPKTVEVALDKPLAGGEKVSVTLGDEAGNTSDPVETVVIIPPTTPTHVKDPTNLTEDEKNHIKKGVEEANKNNPNFPKNPEITVDNKGNVTVTDKDKDGKEVGKLTPDQTTSTGDSMADTTDVTKPKTPVNVNDPNNLTKEEKKKVEDAITGGNTLPEGSKVTVDGKGNVTITYPDGSSEKLDNEGIVATDPSKLKALVEEAPTVKGTDTYTNADPDKKKAYDDAIAEGDKVLKDKNSTQAQIDAAAKKITDAKNALNGTTTPVQTVDKSGLVTSIGNGDAAKGTPDYTKASPEKKAAFDEALANAKKVNADPDATQEQVNTAKSALDDAIDALDGAERKALEDAINSGNSAKGKPAYTNGSDEAKQGLDEALQNAEDVLAKTGPAATAEELKAATDAINTAIGGLDGTETPAVDKSKLTDAITEANKSKGSTEYTKGSDEKKAALDKALEEAEKVNKDPNATQGQVDKATSDLKKAISELDGEERNSLENLVQKGEGALADPNNANIPEELKKELQGAIDDANKTLEKTPAATPEELKEAENKLQEALDKFTEGKDQVDKDPLNEAIEKGKEAQNTPDYSNSSQDKKDALDKAIEEGQKVIADPNATQKDVEEAKNNIEKAIEDLNGDSKSDKDKVTEELKKLIETIEKAIEKNPNAPGVDTLKEMLDAAKKQLADQNTPVEDLQTTLNKLDAAFKAWLGGIKKEESKTDVQVVKTPKTGDDTNQMGWIALLLTAIGGLFASRKRKED